MNYPNFLDKNNLNNLFKQLQSSSVGAESAQTEGISHEEEIWVTI